MGQGQSVSPSQQWATQSNVIQGPLPFLVKERIQCLLEGGSKCKKEAPHQNTEIAGLHANFVTDKIVAMARPQQSNVIKFELAKRLKKTYQIGLIVNLQEVGEHANCGEGILETSGFSYDPEIFMQQQIEICNLSWRDMHPPNSYVQVLQIVQVMWKRIVVCGEGVCVHCHAGLGRTGLVICCYLLYSEDFRDVDEVIQFVRSKRPGSVQTSKQVHFVYSFYKFLQCLRFTFGMDEEALQKRVNHSLFQRNYQFQGGKIFSNHAYASGLYVQRATQPTQQQPPDNINILQNSNTLKNAWMKKLNSLQPSVAESIDELLFRQNILLHGELQRQLRYTPKLVKDVIDSIKMRNQDAIMETIESFLASKNKNIQQPTSVGQYSNINNLKVLINEGKNDVDYCKYSIEELLCLLEEYLLQFKQAVIKESEMSQICCQVVLSEQHSIIDNDTCIKLLQSLSHSTLHIIQELTDLLKTKDGKQICEDVKVQYCLWITNLMLGISVNTKSQLVLSGDVSSMIAKFILSAYNNKVFEQHVQFRTGPLGKIKIAWIQ